MIAETIETDTPPQNQNGQFSTTTTEYVVPNEIYKKLAAIQQCLKAPKSKTNNFGKYKYRSCEDILESLKPCLAEHGCALIISDDIEAYGTFEAVVLPNDIKEIANSLGQIEPSILKEDKIYVKATATLFDVSGNSVSSTAYARETTVKKGMDAAQITGSASSYARKYALNGLLAIDDTKDPDANGGHAAPSKQVQSAPQAPPLLTPKIIKWAQGRIYEDKSDPIKMNVFLAKLKTQYKVTPEDEEKINLGVLMDEEDLK